MSDLTDAWDIHAQLDVLDAVVVAATMREPVTAARPR